MIFDGWKGLGKAIDEERNRQCIQGTRIFCQPWDVGGACYFSGSFSGSLAGQEIWYGPDLDVCRSCLWDCRRVQQYYQGREKGKKILMQDVQKIVDFITTSNWLILFFAGSIGLMTTSTEFALGIVLGGLIAVINFHLLKKTLKTVFSPQLVSGNGRSVVVGTLIKYYIRFGISGLMIYLLISKHIVHPLGLLAGLSVVVASMFLATVLELTRLYFKEAV